MAVSGMSKNGSFPSVFADVGVGFELSVPRQTDNAFRDSSFPTCACATAAFQDARRPVQRLLLPVVDPVRMNAELTRQLGDRPVPPPPPPPLRFNHRVVLLPCLL